VARSLCLAKIPKLIPGDTGDARVAPRPLSGPVSPKQGCLGYEIRQHMACFRFVDTGSAVIVVKVAPQRVIWPKKALRGRPRPDTRGPELTNAQPPASMCPGDPWPQTDQFLFILNQATGRIRIYLLSVDS
jgi:hypothetical protein